MPYFDAPVLENPYARLEPLSAAHHDELAAAVAVDDLWRAWYTSVPTPESMTEAISARLRLHSEQRMAPWAVIDPATGRAVGMTTFLNLEPENRRLEIGYTWLGATAQGTKVNPAVKRLLLTRAFDELGCIAVEFRTHWHNHQSRAALAKLGAKQDGVLRNHKVLDNGTVRDTVVFSIIDAEWPTVKFALDQRLSR